MSNRLITAIVSGALAATLVVPIAAQADTSSKRAVTGYDNCTALNRDYSHGISDRRKSKQWWIRHGASGKGAYKPNLYRAVHSNLDRDDDHIACES